MSLEYVKELLHYAVEQDATDLHLLSGEPPKLRLFGEIEYIDKYRDPIPVNVLLAALRAMFEDDEDKTRIMRERMSVDFSYEYPEIGARFRVNAFFYRKGVGIVFRYLPSNLKPPSELGIPEVMLDVTNLPNGLILVTGPTGSGKSTTLASMIHHIISRKKVHVITVEDPIEFIFESKLSQVSQREVGSNTPSFLDGLRDALREDPDVIMVGEMRDAETITMAIRAALTGHLVLSTLHTNSAAQTVDRIIETFPPEQQNNIRNILADSLRVVCSQAMFRRVDQKGRCVAFEILLGTPAVRNLIREGKTHQIISAIHSGRQLGMRALDDSIMELLKVGKISPFDAYVKSLDKVKFKPYLKESGRNLFLELV
ncbi:MAG: PilT/PilU family type 4a pilus ATPase [Thermoproteota archaeon]